jgi:energy-coupling factor transport system substrate-specific component
MLGALMFAGRLAMEPIPNVHPLGLIIAATTLVFRAKALIPLYIFIVLQGLWRGFSLWWMPFLYVWLPLWGAFMLLGKCKLPVKARVPVYMAVAGLHGLTFGALYAPMHAVFFGLSFQGMLAWIAVGFPFDIAHAAGNIAAGTLIVPLAALLSKLHSGRWQ